jgi:tRNA uridine 5-carboxymethylaminomethyl modification enzyme
LVTKGTQEPYRMFTSRAEYRLLLRQDNADLRLCDIGHEIGLLPDRNYEVFKAKRTAIESELDRLGHTRINGDSMAQMLRRPHIAYADLPDRNSHLKPEEIQQVEIALKYEGYIARQEVDVAKLKSLEDKQIPAWVNYATVPSLRTEARQKLLKIQPVTLGQASRISGVSPSDVAVLSIWLKNGAVAASQTQENP